MANPFTWSEKDAIALRTFISGNPNFLRAMRARVPEITGTTMEARAVTGSEAQGFINALKAIEQLQQDPHPEGDNAGFIDDNVKE